MEVKLQYALKDDKLVSINDVESGLKCGCICPSCKNKLVARKGNIMAHHFAHYNSEECSNALESAVHLLAKKIILESGYIELPAFNIGRWTTTSSKIYFDRIDVEKRYGNIIPDLTAYIGRKTLFIEVYVTHKIDDEKEKKIIDLGISTIEIDLSEINNFLDEKLLKDKIIQNIDNKKWIYNEKKNILTKKLSSIIEFKKPTKNKKANNFSGCPLLKRTYKGHPYAELYQDCEKCEYSFYIESDCSGIWCTGKNKIASIEDIINFKENFNPSSGDFNENKYIKKIKEINSMYIEEQEFFKKINKK